MHLGCSSIIGRLTDLCTPPPQRLLYKVPDSLSLYRSPYTFYTVNVNNLEVHLTSTLNVCCASGTRQTEYQTVPQHRVTQSNSFHSDFAFQEQFEREMFKPPPHPAVTCVPILQQYIQWERERLCCNCCAVSQLRNASPCLHCIPACRRASAQTFCWKYSLMSWRRSRICQPKDRWTHAGVRFKVPHAAFVAALWKCALGDVTSSKTYSHCKEFYSGHKYVLLTASAYRSLQK